MTENGENGQLPVRRCPGVRRDGTPCGSTILLDDGFCLAHSPTQGGDMAEYGRAGGVASGAARRELGKSVRELLRERVEEEMEVVWAAFHDGLTAELPGSVTTFKDGSTRETPSSPDHKTRVLAAQGLLAEAYGRPAIAASLEVSGPDGQPLSVGTAAPLAEVFRVLRAAGALPAALEDVIDGEATDEEEA